MNIQSIIISAVILIALIFAVAYMLKNRNKSHCSGCTGCCSACGGCSEKNNKS